jgi:hypothetical protein
VGLLCEFTKAQVPLEQALHLVSKQLAEADPGTCWRPNCASLSGITGSGRPSRPASARWRIGVEEVATLVTGISQGKRLGAGMEMILRDQQLLVRMGQRNRASAASPISTRLMGVLVGLYLPEFVILVMVPLFWGLMLRAFG